MKEYGGINKSNNGNGMAAKKRERNMAGDQWQAKYRKLSRKQRISEMAAAKNGVIAYPAAAK
jgi:hypothetical protein